MAGRVGFEPTVTLLLHTLSKRAHSTTLTPALVWSWLLLLCLGDELSENLGTLDSVCSGGNPFFKDVVK